MSRLAFSASVKLGFCAPTAAASAAASAVLVPTAASVATSAFLAGGPPNKLLMKLNALSIKGTPVGVSAAKPPGFSVEPGNWGIPSLARMYGSVGSAPPRASSCAGLNP